MTDLTTTYFEEEGRAAIQDCIHRAADWCLSSGIKTLVIFTGTGEGPHYAAKEVLLRPRYRELRAVAVTPPAGRPYRKDPRDPTSPLVRAGLSEAMRDELLQLSVPVVSAHLPFKETHDGRERNSEWSRVAEAFGVLGGGFALCIQAILVACDAGKISHGEEVVALSADTALAARACRTESFLSPVEGLLVRHIICRPSVYTISKRFHETIAPAEEGDAKATVETTGASLPEPLPPPQLPQPTKMPQGKLTKRQGSKKADRSAAKPARRRR